MQIELNQKACYNAEYDVATYANGYVIYCWNKSTFILTRKNEYLSNPFMVIDGEPVFEYLRYVNPTTIKMCKSFYKKITAQAEDK